MKKFFKEFNYNFVFLVIVNVFLFKLIDSFLGTEFAIMTLLIMILAKLQDIDVRNK